MNDWKTYKLGELTDVVTKGTTPTTIGGGFISEGINFIKSEAVRHDGRIDRNTFVYISQETHQKLKRSQLQKDDILFSMAGIFLGKNAIVTEDILPANTNQALAIIRLNKQKSYPKFISYYLRQNGVVELVNNMSGQSAQPNINFEEIKSIDINLPPLSEQSAIAEVLSSLDDKIDLLHRQNKTLEQLAETLFRQWFIEDAKADWQRTTVGESLATVLGGTPSTGKPEFWDGDIPWINSGEVNRFRIDSPSRFITKLGLEKSNTKLLPKGTTVIAITGATLGQISLLEIDTCANQSVVGIIPNERLTKEFVFFWIKHKLQDILMNETGGAQPHINKNDVNEAELIIPPKELLKTKTPILSDYFGKITNNIQQIRTLTQMRDTLLPKFMSGEVRIDYSNYVGKN